MNIYSTDMTAEYHLTEKNNKNFTLLLLKDQLEYECYQQLVQPRAPFKATSSLSSFVNITQCQSFIQTHNNTPPLQGFYRTQLSSLYDNPGVNVTTFRVIIDNTRVFSTGQEGDLAFTEQVNIKYEVNDKYFNLTVTFGCLDGVVLAGLVALIWLYRRKKIQYDSLLTHKMKKMKGDYKKYDMDESIFTTHQISDDNDIGLLIVPKDMEEEMVFNKTESDSRKASEYKINKMSVEKGEGTKKNDLEIIEEDVMTDDVRGGVERHSALVTNGEEGEGLGSNSARKREKAQL